MKYYLSDEAVAAGITFNTPARLGDAGYDIRCLDEVAAMPGKITLFKTGLHLEIPNGYYGKIMDRSSMAVRSLFVVGGVIDSGYRGELTVGIINISKDCVTFNSGDRIAQIVIMPIFTPELEQVGKLEDLSETERGNNGFGSTGK